MPKVSIIIPNYNHSKYLERRLNSVFNQTYQDVEIILLDDASNDNSLEILTKFSASQKVSHFVVNNENSGSPFKQWHKGIELAVGELIWIAESDDLSKHTFLETMVNLFKDENLVLTYCNSCEINEHDVITEIKWNEELSISHWSTSYINNGNDEINKYLKYRNTIYNASAVVFRKNRYFEVGCVEQNLFYSADWLLWAALIKDRKLAYIDKPLNYFRSHSESTRVIKTFSEEEKRLLENIYIIEYIVKNNNLKVNIIDYFKWNSIFSNFINKNNNIFSKKILLFSPPINKYFLAVFYLKLAFNIFKRCKIYVTIFFKTNK